MAIVRCPVCEVVMTPHSRAGIVVDFCQKCRGVWLDPGEIDLLVLDSGRREATPSLLPEAGRRGYLPAGASEQAYWRMLSDHD